MIEPKLAFEPEAISIPLANLIPVRLPPEVETGVKRFSTILSSIQEMGVIEPLAVYPHKASKGKFLILDGNLRYHALQKLGETDALCIIANEDESFTYNARISRMSPIQEHRMIAKAVKHGVPVERLAVTLNLGEAYVRQTLNLLEGLHPAAIEILEARHVSHAAIKAYKRVVPERQIEMAELMVAGNDFSAPYATALLAATPDDKLVKKRVHKKQSISEEEEARLREEMQHLEADFKAVDESYGDNFLKFTTAKGYLNALLGNAKVAKWLKQRHPEIVEQFETIVNSDAL